VAYRQARAATRAPFAPDGRFDAALLYDLLEASTVAVEGAPAIGDGRFFGSATWTLSLGAHEAARLGRVLSDDSRARRVVADQVHRELARLLGPDLPTDLALTFATESGAEGLRLAVDFEGSPAAVQVGAAR
jgi:hypothetical protein